MIPSVEELRQETKAAYDKLLAETVNSLCSGWVITMNTAGKVRGESSITFEPTKDTYTVSWPIACNAVYLAAMEFVKVGYKVELRYYNKVNKMVDKITISWGEDIPEDNLIIHYGVG